MQINIDDLPSETDFYPWLLVAHRRGCGHGHRDGIHASHMDVDVAAAEQTDGTIGQIDISIPKHFVAGGLRDGMRRRARGGFLACHTQHFEYDKVDMTPLSDCTIPHGSLMECTVPNNPRDSNPIVSWDSSFGVIPI